LVTSPASATDHQCNANAVQIKTPFQFYTVPPLIPYRIRPNVCFPDQTHPLHTISYQLDPFVYQSLSIQGKKYQVSIQNMLKHPWRLLMSYFQNFLLLPVRFALCAVPFLSFSGAS